MVRRDQDPGKARLAGYAAASTGLALLSDRRLGELLAAAEPLGSGIGGALARLRIGAVPVFVKKVPVTELELRPDNVMSTANLFGLPGFYQYGIGSAGFGAWRELAAHVMTTNWVLADEHQNFPPMYHWRVLPQPPADTDSDSDTAAAEQLEAGVEYWEGDPAVRGRLKAIRDARASLVFPRVRTRGRT
ncbi:MAG TPA: hypothetical protein VGX23_05620 [Actinocrinis sp.]|nr:hypothetical protein [Actinocrinis sp.]